MLTLEKINKYYEQDTNLENFFNYIKVIMPETSVETYIFGIINFLRFLKNKNIDLYKTNEISLYEYITELKNKNMSNSTIVLYSVAIRKYINYLNQNGYNIKLNVPQLPKISMLTKYKNVLSDENVSDYLRLVFSNFKEPYKTLLSIMPYCGLRIDEIINLKLNDISNENGWLVLKVLGKGNKYREVPLLSDGNKILAKYLSGWRDIFYKKISKKCQYLFPNVRFFDKPISYMNIYSKVKRIARSLNIKITPHTFRATYATKLSNAGVNTITIMKLLGHSSSTTTSIYDRPSSIELIDRIRSVKYYDINP